LVEHVLKSICSEHGGIAQSLLVSPVRYADGIAIKSIAAQMPGYHRVLLDPNLAIQYHLGGYGMFYEEALIRLAGEVIERYSLMVAQYTLGDRLRYATYDEIERRGKAVPLEYLRLFSDSDYAKLKASDYRGLRRLERNDVVGWVRCPSLFDPGTDVWVPAQMLFVGYKLGREHGEVSFNPGFSTGTAAHTSLVMALQNALLEFVEIDALMLKWYTRLKAPSVSVDNLTVTSRFPELFSSDSRFEVLVLDLRVLESIDACVLGVVLMNKGAERPFIMFGAQGHLDPVRAFYRGLMEAVAIAFLGSYGPLYLPQQYFPSTTKDNFTDLDRNVAFFASPEDGETKRRVIGEMIDGTKVLSGMKSYDTGNAAADTARLIRQLSSVSEYAVFLDVTPPETRAKGWHVMRVFIPELVTMCVPGIPYSEHPRILKFGGIQNQYPHPLP